MIAGAAILTVFGAWWCIAALANWPQRPTWSIPAAYATTIVLLVLCTLRLVASRKIPSIQDPTAAAKGKRAGKLFGLIFGIEGGLIALCSMLLASRGLGLWIPVAVAIIVGVHFLPLAHVFGVPLYYWTGALSVLGVLGCLLIRDMNTRLLWVGLVMAAVLWLSVAVLLLQTQHTQSARA
jgi:hypothetical protein